MTALPFTSALTDDAELAPLFAPAAELRAMLDFETALAAAQAEAGMISAAASAAIAQACAAFTPDEAALRAGLFKDGVLGPGFVAALRKTLPAEHQKALHLGATSQDVTDTALAYRLKRVLEIFDARLNALIAALQSLSAAQGGVRLMGQTRMQAALPILARDKIASWVQPLHRHLARLADLAPRLLVIQLGGPVGNRAELGEAADAVAAGLAARLGLGDAPCWHTARDTIVEFGEWLAMIAGALGKFGQDAAILAQSENGALKIEGGGASSAMAHKVNPVTAEHLVALARFAGGLAGTLNQALVHENERSGAAWTLEWLVLPQLVCASGAALQAGLGLTKRLHFIDRTKPGDDHA